MIESIVSLPLWVILLAIAVAIVGVGRLVRVIVHDSFPPAEWWRNTWSRMTKDGPWAMLFLCYWCLPFWVVLFCIGWFVLGMLVTWIAVAWWVFWGALAIAYAASMVIARDDPADQ